MSKKLKVLLFASYPSEGLPQWGIFNARSARSLSLHSEVHVISIRTWKFGRPFVTKTVEDGIFIYHCSIPHIPVNQKQIFLLSQWSTRMFLRLFFTKLLKSSDIYHSVGAVPKGYCNSKLAAEFSKNHIIQLIGGDVNADLPILKANGAIHHFPKKKTMIVGNSLAIMQEFNRVMNTDFSERFVYRGVDLEKFSFQPMPSSKEGIRFLFMGGFSSYQDTQFGMNTKGGLSLLKAWKLAEEELFRCGAKLTIAGPDTDNCLDLLAEIKYLDQIEIVGSLKPEEVKESFKKHHVVVIPSMEEGLPNVAVEAFASGRTVIGSDAGGIPEIVDELTGALFNRGNFQALAKLLVQFTEENASLVEKGKKAREKVEKQFNKDNFGLSYYNYYQELIQNSCVE